VNATIQASAPPVITTSVSGVTFGNVVVGQTSTVRRYEVSATNVQSGSLLLTAPAGYEIATSINGPYGSVINIPATGCSVPNTEIFVRFRPMSIGANNSSITHVIGAVTVHVNVSGAGVATQAQAANVLVDNDWATQADVDNDMGPGVRTLGVDASRDLQTAIDIAPNNGVIVLRPGNHPGTNVRVHRPVEIVGEGVDVSIIVPQQNLLNTFPLTGPQTALDAGFDHHHALIIQNNDVIIRNLTIDGDANRDCAARFGVGIITDDRTGVPYRNLMIDNVALRHLYARGVQIFGAGNGNTIANSIIDDICMRNDNDVSVRRQAAGVFISSEGQIFNNSISRTGSGVFAQDDFAG